MGRLGNLGYVVKYYGLKIKETTEGRIRGSTAIICKKISVMSRGLGGMVTGLGDKAADFRDKVQVQGSGEKVLNNLESELS